MLIGRVIGEVVSTQKHSAYESLKILLVQPLNLDGSNRGAAVIAVDAVNAGIGDRVLVTTDGYAAFTSVKLPASPIDMAVVGIVDQVELSVGLDFALAPAPPPDKSAGRN